jgi:hypothetical protein
MCGGTFGQGFQANGLAWWDRAFLVSVASSSMSTVADTQNQLMVHDIHDLNVKDVVLGKSACVQTIQLSAVYSSMTIPWSLVDVMTILMYNILRINMQTRKTLHMRLMRQFGFRSPEM